MNDLTVNFNGEKLAVEIASYSDNGSTALRFVDLETGAPYLMATTNLAESSGLTPWQFFLKDWSENTGVPLALAKHVHKIGLPVASGFVKVSLYEVNEDSPLHDMISVHVDEGGTPVSKATEPLGDEIPYEQPLRFTPNPLAGMDTAEVNSPAGESPGSSESAEKAEPADDK